MATQETQQKAVHSLILDTGPLIKNTVSISTIINSAEELYTTPTILSEIRDDATRSRVQTTLMPFLKVRNPSPASFDAIIAFSKKTGDYAVLSRQDLGILALAYEVHCERNGGSFGLRETPKGPIKRRPGEEVEVNEVVKKEKKQNNTRNKIVPTPEEVQIAEQLAADEDEGWEQPRGKRATKSKAMKPTKFKYEFIEQSANDEGSFQPEHKQGTTAEVADEEGGIAVTSEQIEEQEALQQPLAHGDGSSDVIQQQQESTSVPETTQEQTQSATSEVAPNNQDAAADTDQSAEEPLQSLVEPLVSEKATAGGSSNLEEDIADLSVASPTYEYQTLTPPQTDGSASDTDSDGDWITPGNLPTHQAKDSGLQSTTRTSSPRQMDVATMTIDFAMQNVLLQMNLHLLSTNLQRIKHVNTKVLRCHACFAICKEMSRQFCPRCGQATLARVSCSTNARGEFRIHLARNYQYNKRGDKFSVPKPIAGTANGKWSGQGGGKGGWGRDLILAEDQKEFANAVTQEKRNKTRDLMDEDYLPGILTGDRGRAGGRVKVGAGKNVNSKKRS